MVSREITTVRWGSVDSPVVLYGTALRLAASGEVHLVNDLMPSGTTMQEWYSYTDYQSVRAAPTLPALHHGGAYRVVPAMRSVPDDSVVFDVRFFDRFDELVSTQVLYAPDYAFEFPAGCHHYTIRLVNAGCDELRFSSFALLEVEEGERHGEQ